MTARQQTENGQTQISLANLTLQPRDEVIAQVMAFLLERGYTITAPDGRLVSPPGSTDQTGPA